MLKQKQETLFQAKCHSRGNVANVTTNTKVKWPDGIKGSQFAPPEKKEEARVNLAAID